MNACSLVVTSVIASVLLSESVHAQRSSAYLASIGTKAVDAVDAKGVRHNGDDYPRRHPPWLDDIIKGVAPEYPIWDRAQRHQGMGSFQLTLDLKTGAVMAVSVTKSTGFKTLDDAAIAARVMRCTTGKENKQWKYY
jgi:hypothetical protein